MPEGGGAHPAASELSREAVAVTTVSPIGNGKLTGPKVALQFASVVATVEPRKCFPSPKPAESHAGLEKNSRRKLVLATLSKVPDTVTLLPLIMADVITG
jgi:hypothetical protein